MGVVSDSRRRLGKGVALSLAVAAGMVCASAVTWAQTSGQGKTILVEPPTPLLPATLGKLARQAEGDSGDGLGQVDAAEAPVLKEDGLRRFARSDYAQGAEHGTVTVYQFADASGAISAYDYFRRLGMHPEKAGDSAVSGGDELLMRSGKNVVRENGRLSHDAAATQELIDHLPKALGSTGVTPMLPTLLPTKGLDAESVHYALGPVGYKAMGGIVPPDAVGFDKSAETVTAKYRSGGTLTLALYPTPEIAGEHTRSIESAMKQQGEHAGTVMLRREGTLVAIASGAWSANGAQAIVESAHLRSEITFDKAMPPEFHTEIRKTYTLLESIAMFCGLGAVAAIVLGLFFGYGRAVIRVMMGKPAATEPEFLRIDLRGSPGKNLKSGGT